MMFEFREIESHDLWQGCQWSILEVDELAKALAFIALGRAEHVEKILAQFSTLGPNYPDPASAAESAKSLLSVADGQDSYHRDGWVFQCISFVAACLQDSASLKAPPHMIHADKGFDGLQIVIPCLDDPEISKVIITEDKATENARNTVTQKIWPDFEKVESNKVQSALIARTTEVLRLNSVSNAGEIVAAVFWHESRVYRVAITVTATHNSAEGRDRLFKGYDTAVAGEGNQRRRVETFFSSDIRSYLSNLSSRAIALIDDWAAANV